MRRLPIILSLMVVGTVATRVHSQDLDWIDSPDVDGPPLWVSATRAVDGVGGALREEIFDAQVIQGIEELLGSATVRKTPQLQTITDLESYLSEHPCDATTITTGEGAPLLPGSLAPGPRKEAFADADLVIWGSVEAYSPGFLGGGRFASLYELDVGEWLKAPHEIPRVGSIFFTYEVAKAMIDGIVWCARGSRGTQSPRIGGEVLIMAKSSAILHTDPVVIETVSALYFETGDDEVSSPPGTEGAPAEWSRLADQVREMNR